MVGVVPPPLHEYDNVPVPPVAVAVAVPSLPPKQLTGVAEAVTEGPAELVSSIRLGCAASKCVGDRDCIDTGCHACNRSR
jgi:hypothetical protein